MRTTKLQKLLDSRTNRSAPVFADMVEPPLDHVSHMLPERRSNLAFVFNQIEVDEINSGLDYSREESDVPGYDDYEESELSEFTDEEEWCGNSEHGNVDVS